MVTNLAIDNPKLTFATVGILAYILRQRGDTRIDIKSLAALGRGGRALVSKALQELETAGFLERKRIQGARGRWHTECIVHEEPLG